MNTCLFIDTNGKIRVNEFPEKPKYCYNTCRQDNMEGCEDPSSCLPWTDRLSDYNDAVQAALDNGVECEDKIHASAVLALLMPSGSILEAEPMKPYPIPDYKMEVKYLIDGPDHRSGGWEEVTEEMYNFVQDGLFGFKKKKLATLTLIINV